MPTKWSLIIICLISSLAIVFPEMFYQLNVLVQDDFVKDKIGAEDKQRRH
jgi:hypothetical protein